MPTMTDQSNGSGTTIGNVAQDRPTTWTRRPGRKAQVLVVANHAGGAGKTTVTINLGYALAQMGLRVLLLDVDPQRDLSGRLLGLVNPPDCTTIDQLMLETVPRGTPRMTPVPARCEWKGVGFDLLPCDHTAMKGIELYLEKRQKREEILARIIQALLDLYDAVLIDCPPSLGLLTVNALYAADSLLVPVEADPKGYNLLPQFMATLAEVQEERADYPRLSGIILTKTKDATISTRSVRTALEAEFPAEQLYGTEIRERETLVWDRQYKAPVGVYARKSDSAQDFERLAAEVIQNEGI